ncbi:MAG TPA: hypothetical protein VGD57_00975, partial [Candidatus Dormibacteraeota bacterium]
LPSIGRWMAGYVLVLFAFLFFSRFLNDSYLGVIVALASALPALAGEGALLGWKNPRALSLPAQAAA